MDQDDLKERAQKLEELREKFQKKRASKMRAKKMAKARASVNGRSKVDSMQVKDIGQAFRVPRSVSGGSSVGRQPPGSRFMGAAGAGFMASAVGRFSGGLPGVQPFGSPFFDRQRESATLEALLTRPSLTSSRATGDIFETPAGARSVSSGLATPCLDRVMRERMVSLNSPLNSTATLAPLESRMLQVEAARRSLLIAQLEGECQRREMLQNIHARRSQLERSISDASAKRGAAEEESKRSGAWGDDFRGAPKRMRFA